MNTIQRFIAKLFGIRTVDSILSASKKQISDLETVSTQLQERSKAKEEQAKEKVEQSTKEYQEALKKAQEKVEKDKEYSLSLEKAAKVDVREATRAKLISDKLKEVYEITAEEIDEIENKGEL